MGSTSSTQDISMEKDFFRFPFNPIGTNYFELKGFGEVKSNFALTFEMKVGIDLPVPQSSSYWHCVQKGIGVLGAIDASWGVFFMMRIHRSENNGINAIFYYDENKSMIYSLTSYYLDKGGGVTWYRNVATNNGHKGMSIYLHDEEDENVIYNNVFSNSKLGIQITLAREIPDEHASF